MPTIRDSQRALRDAGYYHGSIDGDWGKLSHEAVLKAIQSDRVDVKTHVKPNLSHEFSQRDINRLKGVHPDLVAVISRAKEISDVDFFIGEGLRTKKRQRELVAKGASKTMRSRHLTGHAVDLVVIENGEVTWHYPLYKKLSKAVKQAAKELSVPIKWGGDWRRFRDGPHYQLTWKNYP